MITTVYELVKQLSKNDPDSPIEVNLDGRDFLIDHVEHVDQGNEVARIHLDIWKSSLEKVGENNDDS